MMVIHVVVSLQNQSHLLAMRNGFVAVFKTDKRRELSPKPEAFPSSDSPKTMLDDPR